MNVRDSGGPMTKGYTTARWNTSRNFSWWMIFLAQNLQSISIVSPYFRCISSGPPAGAEKLFPTINGSWRGWHLSDTFCNCLEYALKSQKKIRHSEESLLKTTLLIAKWLVNLQVFAQLGGNQLLQEFFCYAIQARGTVIRRMPPTSIFEQRYRRRLHPLLRCSLLPWESVQQ